MIRGADGSAAASGSTAAAASLVETAARLRVEKRSLSLKSCFSILAEAFEIESYMSFVDALLLNV